jgi:tetratricopeptide (TPR) repeat protein
MKKNRVVLSTVVAAAGLACLAGCAGQPAHVESADGAAGPVARSTDDYRKIRFEEAFRGLAVSDGLIIVDRAGARGLQVGDAAQAMLRGDARLAENDFTGAIGEYRTALLSDDTNAGAYAGIGRALLGKKKDDMALAAYRTAVALAPQNTEYRLAFAETTNATGDLEGWARELEALLTLDPEHGEAHARLAVARYYLGDNDAARREVELADRFGGSVPAALRGMLNN